MVTRRRDGYRCAPPILRAKHRKFYSASPNEAFNAAPTSATVGALDRSFSKSGEKPSLGPRFLVGTKTTRLVSKLIITFFADLENVFHDLTPVAFRTGSNSSFHSFNVGCGTCFFEFSRAARVACPKPDKSFTSMSKMGMETIPTPSVVSETGQITILFFLRYAVAFLNTGLTGIRLD